MRTRIAVVIFLVVGLLPAAAVAQDAKAVEQACPRAVPDARFRDVDADHLHDDAIDCAVWWDISRGTSRRRYQPAREVTREQMATFAARLVLRSGGHLPASPDDRFSDDDASPHHYSINRLAAVGVVGGSGRRFRPEGTVTRGQMATLLVNAYEHRTGAMLPAGRERFYDDASSVHEDNINTAAAAGFVAGTGGGRFRPFAAVTRAQMASFVTRVLQAIADAGAVEQSPATKRAASQLETYDECEPLLGHLKERGTESVGAFGWGYGDRLGGGDGEVPDTGGGPTPSPPSAPGEETPTDGGEGGDRDYSGTNNQEEGVDEADIVKTDGDTIFAVNGGRLRAIDVTGADPVVADVLQVPGADSAQLLMSGTQLLVLGTTYATRDDGGSSGGGAEPGFGGTVSSSGPTFGAASVPPIGGYDRPQTVLTTIDAADPANLRIEQVLTVDGMTITGRMVDDIARIVYRSDPPDLDFIYPDDEGVSYEEAEQHNRRAVEESEMADWLPAFRLEDRRSGAPVTSEGTLLGCDDIGVPPEYSGLGTINVLTADPNGELADASAASVLAGGETVYASSENLYVATTHWGPWTPEPVGPERVTTEIHRFAIDDPAGSTYEGSGKITGTLLNQFSMSELDGHLRVAATSQPTWWGDGEEEASESSVFVLAQDAGALEVVGQVDGLGRGEQIFAVRFLGELGYVVTFRQIDPLYVVDLSDPTAPAVTGELKILGYSAYLHPVGEGRLLGVGQDADEEGRQRGTQLSLFDVSDPTAPTRIAQAGLGEGTYSDVEFEHRAFLHWTATGTTVLPISRYTYDPESEKEDFFVGAAGFDVSASSIDEIAEISHGDESADRWPGILRSVVVEDTLYTLSDLGLKGSDISTLTERSWTAFES